MAALRGVAAAVGVLILLAAGPAPAQIPTSEHAHLGVASCSGGNCHGAIERPPGSSVPGNEYLIWSKRDKHRQAYTVLLGEQGLRIAKALGLPDAANQSQCLDCHADNVPAALRGRQFQLSDGVGCEACHGGAADWLGPHISGAGHRANVAAGLYPVEKPIARAEKCLGCHYGDGKRFVDHRLYGAGHPRLGFELDTYTAIEPAHVVVDQGYVERKGVITDSQVWATGQAVALVKRMSALLDPMHAEHGVFPEFAFYECQSCHHPMDPAHGPMPTTTGLPPGTVKLEDSNAAMLAIAASRAAPAASRTLGAETAGMNRASIDNPDGVKRAAATLRDVAKGLVPVVATHQFGDAENRAIAEALIAHGTGPDGWHYPHAEQTTMGLEAVIAALKSSGAVGPAQSGSLQRSMDTLYESFAGEAGFRPPTFVTTLRQVQRALGK